MKENALDVIKENPSEKRIQNVLSINKIGGGTGQFKLSGPKHPKRIRPWQRLGFKSKKQYLIAKKNGDLNELEMLISQKS